MNESLRVNIFKDLKNYEITTYKFINNDKSQNFQTKMSVRFYDFKVVYTLSSLKVVRVQSNFFAA